MDASTDADAAASFWFLTEDQLLALLGTSAAGLSTDEACRRRTGRLAPEGRTGRAALFFNQFKSPIILILLAATVLSFFVHDPVNALIILAIILMSALLSFYQEAGAADAVGKLLNMVRIKASVLRDGIEAEINVEDVVPGDIIIVHAGDVVPADCRLLEARDLFVDEAALTGESYPAEKAAGQADAHAPLARRSNALWMGTHVASGMGRAVAAAVGGKTQFGAISGHLKLRPPETEFERGIRRFGFFLMQVTLVLVLLIFGVNVFLGRPVLETFLFALALAVGLTPQLLPAIISINLAHGARRMAERKVIVKRLASIENFGSMNVLCSDKTGTLTEGRATLQGAVDIEGKGDGRVLLYAVLNAGFETGFKNPIDDAIRAAGHPDAGAYAKVDEIPYDFSRKRLSILASRDGQCIMVSKGALANILDVCAEAETPGGGKVPMEAVRDRIRAQFEDYSRQGSRVLGVAYRNMGEAARIGKADEAGMVFAGFLLFADPLKPDIAATVASLNGLGISLKVITGDNCAVAQAVGRQIGFSGGHMLSGRDLATISDDALVQRVQGIEVFAEVEPNQKERIIRALQKAGNVVGYMGDGINDASALHAADVGISVDSAVDVAKEAADIVLLEQDLKVLVQGVREGRVTFANTLKYVFMATSANFGNMFSMAGASLFLPFLPLLPKQVLLTNILTDIPEMAIASDTVDPEFVGQPRRWDIRFIRRFMVVFGCISSVFDYVTFAVLLWGLRAAPGEFRTAWFVESVVSAALIVLVIRTRRPFFKSRPGSRLTMATLVIAAATLAVPWTPLGGVFGFQPLPTVFLPFLAGIILFYVLAVEAAKLVFYRSSGGSGYKRP